MAASIDRLHASKPDVLTDEQALSRVAPVTHAHVNSCGRSELDHQPPPEGQLRPLRQGGSDDGAVPTPPLGVSGDKHQSLVSRRCWRYPDLVMSVATGAIEDASHIAAAL
jgi:hypothetical protein